VYNGDDKIHCFKSGAVTDPTGMIELTGPELHAGPRHDSMIETIDGVNVKLEHAQQGRQRQWSTYGDKAFYPKSHLLSAFKGDNLVQWKKSSNTQLKKSRVSVEWTFGKVTQIVKQVDNYRQHKWKLSQLGKVYILAMLLTNSHTCLYGSQSSIYFGVRPPTLGAYFRVAHLIDV
jgi:hypothetical protein